MSVLATSNGVWLVSLSKIWLGFVQSWNCIRMLVCVSVSLHLADIKGNLCPAAAKQAGRQCLCVGKKP